MSGRLGCLWLACATAAPPKRGITAPLACLCSAASVYRAVELHEDGSTCCSGQPQLEFALKMVRRTPVTCLQLHGGREQDMFGAPGPNPPPLPCPPRLQVPVGSHAQLVAAQQEVATMCLLSTLGHPNILPLLAARVDQPNAGRGQGPNWAPDPLHAYLVLPLLEAGGRRLNSKGCTACR